MNQKQNETMTNNFGQLNFNYSPLLWHFSTKNSQNKIEQVQGRCLLIVLNDFLSGYVDLLQSSGSFQ